MDVAAATLSPYDQGVWAALSLFPSGLDRDDIASVLAAVGEPEERTMRLYGIGVVQRCEAGVRVPRSLRLLGPSSAPSPTFSGLSTPAVADLWRAYVRRATAVVAAVAAAEGDRRSSRDPAGGPDPRTPRATRDEQRAADLWLSRQGATLRRLAAEAPVPEGALALARAGLIVHQTGIAPDTFDRVFVRLVEQSLAPAAAPAHPAGAGGSVVSGEPGAGPAVAGGPPGPAPVVDPARAAALADLAQVAAILEDQRRFGTAALLAQALVDVHRRGRDPAAEAAVLCQLGRSERLNGQYDQAEAHLLAARQRYEQLGDSVGEGSALFELGQADIDRGHLDDAEAHLGAALALFAANDRPIGEANAHLDLVRVDLARGRLASAERRLADAIDRYDAAGHQLGSANARLQLGQLELARGQLETAQRHFAAALDGYEKSGDKVGFANACLQLGQVDLARGRMDSAERFFSGALAGYERVGDKVGRANAALQLGQIDLARGRLDPAAERLSEALAAYEQLGDRIGLANSSLQLGQVHLGRGELDDAQRRLIAAQGTYDDIGDRMGSANSRHLEAVLRQAQGRRLDAMVTFGEAARLYRALGRTASAGWSLAGAAHNSTGRAERHGYAADAVRCLEDAGLPEAAVQVTAEFAEPPEPPEPEPVAAFEPWPMVKPPPPSASDLASDDAASMPEPAPLLAPAASVLPDPIPEPYFAPDPELPDDAPIQRRRQPGHDAARLLSGPSLWGDPDRSAAPLTEEVPTMIDAAPPAGPAPVEPEWTPWWAREPDGFASRGADAAAELIDPRELVRVAHGDPVPAPPDDPDGSPTGENWLWSADPTQVGETPWAPAPDPPDGESSGTSHSRAGRQKERAKDRRDPPPLRGSD
jgi:tetratricopeptide (TPR) repeat protein